MPVTESLLRKTAMLMRSPPPDVLLRAGDAIHTATALETGETEIWTNDRHLLAAVAHFGLAGRSAAFSNPKVSLKSIFISNAE